MAAVSGKSLQLALYTLCQDGGVEEIRSNATFPEADSGLSGFFLC
jgi:hypothetical protein